MNPVMKAHKNMSSYACVNTNSRCISSQMLPDISVSATMALQATPTWNKGAKISTSAKFPDQYPCHGICSNAIGDYSCSCQPGTHSIDPKKETCSPNTTSERARLTKMFIGISVCAILLLSCIFALLIECQKRKLMKEKEKVLSTKWGSAAV